MNWNNISVNPSQPGKYLGVLYKHASLARPSDQYISIEEWYGKEWNPMGNWSTQIVLWQNLPFPYRPENPNSWILCTDSKIPKKYENYLVTVISDRDSSITVMIDNMTDGGWDANYDEFIVIAWQPLPNMPKYIPQTKIVESSPIIVYKPWWKFWC